MSSVLDQVMDMLREAAVPFELIHHRADYTAQETAQDTHTPGRRFIKTVVVRINDDLALALLPAPRMVNVEAIQQALGASRVRLASEAEIAERFPACEVGALPPFGSLFGVPVYSDLPLDEDELVTFTAGTHRDAIRMRYGDLRRLVGATPLTFAE